MENYANMIRSNRGQDIRHHTSSKRKLIAFCSLLLIENHGNGKEGSVLIDFPPANQA